MTETKTAGDTYTPLDGGTDSGTPRSLGKDDIYHLLQNSRRRAVVRYFATFDEPASLGELAEQIAAWECDTSVDAVTKDQRQRVYIALYQSHLDKLDAHDVIEYDGTQGAIHTASNFHLLRAYLAADTDDVQVASSESSGLESDVPWSSCYLGVAVGGLVPMAGHALHVVPDRVLSLQVLSAILVATYLVMTSAQYLLARE